MEDKYKGKYILEVNCYKHTLFDVGTKVMFDDKVGVVMMHTKICNAERRLAHGYNRCFAALVKFEDIVPSSVWINEGMLEEVK